MRRGGAFNVALRPPRVFLTAMRDPRHGDAEDNCVNLKACEEVNMPLLLSQDEYEFLLELLQQTRRDLREELHKTEAHDFRMALKKKESILESLLQKVELEGFVEAKPEEVPWPA